MVSPPLLSTRQQPGRDQCTISNSLCKSLDRVQGKWVEKLPGVLWAYETSKRILVGETPFSLSYGMEVVIPVDIWMPTFRTGEIDRDENDVQLCLAQDKSEDR